MFVKAIIDFRSCLGNDPTNAAAKNQLSSTLKLQHDQVQAEKSLYSNMFKNLSKETEKVTSFLSLSSRYINLHAFQCWFIDFLNISLEK